MKLHNLNPNDVLALYIDQVAPDMKLLHFTERDFLRCTPPCKLSDMDSEFMTRLDFARFYSGKVAEQTAETCIYALTSAFRTVEHELSKNRKGTSSHTKRIAVDVIFTSPRHLFLIIAGLMAAGFTRIGINFELKFVHVDSDQNKADRIFFSY